MSPDDPPWWLLFLVLTCAFGLWKMAECFVWIATHVHVEVVG